VFVLRKEPITINEYTYYTNGSGTDKQVIYETATLYVPLACRQAYAEAEGWKLFANIEEMAHSDEQGIVYTLGDGNQYTVTGHTDALKSEIAIASEVKGLPPTGRASHSPARWEASRCRAARYPRAALICMYRDVV